MGKTGRRIWYGIAMFLSVLILLISAASIAGVWIAERALANTVVQLVDAVDKVTVSLQQATQGVDQKLASMQEGASFVATALNRLGDKVNDQGLLRLLLPDEKEQNLAVLSASVKESIGSLRDTLSAGLAIYRAADRLPFIDLPAPGQDQIDKITQGVDELQSTAESLQADITALRSGASDKVNNVGSGAQKLNVRLGESRDRLANIDARLALVQEKLGGIAQTVGRILFLAASLLTLLMAWVVYSEVELVRLYIHRWKAAGTKGVTTGTPDQTAGVEEKRVPENPEVEGAAV
jgi:hypothetical protein